MSRTYHDMFRPVYELPSCLSWGASSALLAALHPPMWPVASLTVALASVYRGKQAVDLYRFRASLSALRVETVSVASALAISSRLLKTDGAKPKKTDGKGGFWLGRGF